MPADDQDRTRTQRGIPGGAPPRAAYPGLFALDQAHDDIELGEMLVAVTVQAANVVRDIQQNLRNLVGGRMGHYETLVETAIEQALGKLQTKARERGYDGVLGVKIAHPQVVDGGVEIVVYGNGFRRVPPTDGNS